MSICSFTVTCSLLSCGLIALNRISKFTVFSVIEAKFVLSPETKLVRSPETSALSVILFFSIYSIIYSKE
jgi:hypothetical protein